VALDVELPVNEDFLPVIDQDTVLGAREIDSFRTDEVFLVVGPVNEENTVFRTGVGDVHRRAVGGSVVKEDLLTRAQSRFVAGVETQMVVGVRQPKQNFVRAVVGWQRGGQGDRHEQRKQRECQENTKTDVLRIDSTHDTNPFVEPIVPSQFPFRVYEDPYFADNELIII